MMKHHLAILSPGWTELILEPFTCEECAGTLEETHETNACRSDLPVATATEDS